MFIVHFTQRVPANDSSNLIWKYIDEWHHYDTLEEAGILYDKLKEMPEVYCAGIAAVMESTDHEIHTSFK